MTRTIHRHKNRKKKKPEAPRTPEEEVRYRNNKDLAFFGLSARVLSFPVEYRGTDAVMKEMYRSGNCREHIVPEVVYKRCMNRLGVLFGNFE